MGRMISRQEAAKLLDTDEQTVSNWCEKGVLTAKKVNGRLMVDRKTITDLFDDYKALDATEHNIKELLEKERSYEKELREKVHALRRDCLYVGVNGGRVVSKEFLQTFVCWADSELTMREQSILLKIIDKGDIDEIAKEYGLTRTRVLQIGSKAVRKLFRMKDYGVLQAEYMRMKTEYDIMQKSFLSVQDKMEHYKALYEGKVSMAEAIPDEVDDLYELFQKKLVDMNLTTRTLTAMKCGFKYWNDEKNRWDWKPIETIGELCRCGKTDLLKIRNFGKKSLTELDDMLDSLGLGFSMDVDKIYEQRAMRLAMKIRDDA